MKKEHRVTVVNERLRNIISRVESAPNTNHLKLLEPSAPIQILPKTSTCSGEDENSDVKQSH
ncbi:hypothetical protein [Brasilonema sp. UFV-L1]|uniref:hypothetical protein n=1 Tax=Brasilonema sp. UFV-L1 TaxID=2234130 RepID=UPI00145EAFFF|nr:hypothetical protein [Brasilonema sp. UFV-L1]NMG08373.1 hypothetical protein [Brasilonema sp. UFV-L1]